jgi:hypothetical protein
MIKFLANQNGSRSFRREFVFIAVEIASTGSAPAILED